MNGLHSRNSRTFFFVAGLTLSMLFLQFQALYVFGYEYIRTPPVPAKVTDSPLQNTRSPCALNGFECQKKGMALTGHAFINHSVVSFYFFFDRLS
jgi:hypothetical protein